MNTLELYRAKEEAAHGRRKENQSEGTVADARRSAYEARLREAGVKEEVGG